MGHSDEQAKEQPHYRDYEAERRIHDQGGVARARGRQERAEGAEVLQVCCG